MTLSPITSRQTMSEDDLSVLWRSIDWTELLDALQEKQKALSLAAFQLNWEQVDILQKELVCSWAARALAVRTVSNSNTEAGVDGVRWTSDAQKAHAALTLTARGYRPLPYRHTTVVERGKSRIIHVPTAHDKAMLTLYAFALDPVSEATADGRSFFARKGRSLHDLHAYLLRDLSGKDAPEWACILDVKSFYSQITQSWLIENIPMDKTVLRKFLKAGVVIKGDLFPTEAGISLGTSLSPILGNMTLDGLQSYIYDRLYPNGRTDYLDGTMSRFADDIIILCRTREQANRIIQASMEFLSERGLKLNHEKSYIVNVHEGFDFLSRHYQKKGGILYATPSDNAIKRIEHELDELITDFRGSQRDLIGKVNRKLTGWATYHRVTDAYMDFRHIDAIVEGLLVDKMCTKYRHWKRQTVLNKFWTKEGEHFVFALPNDPSCRIRRLAPLDIVRHKPCKLKFNPYLDLDYYNWLQRRREVQKANGKYYEVWTRQNGMCAYCGEAMLPDQEVEVVEKVIGRGRHVGNLLYIHRQCAYDTVADMDRPREHINLFTLLENYLCNTPPEKSPYKDLTEFFRLKNEMPITLTFQQIEKIIGEPLPWEADQYEAFWLDDEPGTTSPMWQEEGYSPYPVEPSPRDYCICESWLSQGYDLKAVHLKERRVVFRRTVTGMSGLKIPQELTRGKLPDAAVYEAERFFAYLIRRFGLSKK